MALELATDVQGACAVIRVHGEVDLYASPQLRAAILKAVQDSSEGVHVDLSHVAYMDSSGVATLVEGLKAAGQAKTLFVILDPSPPVRKVLQLSKLDTIFAIREST